MGLDLLSFRTALEREGPDGPALVFENGPRVSRHALAALIRAQAEGFSELAEGFAEQAGDKGKMLIAIEARRSVDAITAYLGALEAGHATALLPPDDPAAWDRFEAAFQPEITARVENGAWRIARRERARAAPLHADLALLLSTSGSTGAVKQVRLSYANLEANAAAIAAYLGLGPEDRAAHVLPLHYCYGLSVLHAHLAVGASLWLPSGSVRDPGFAEALDEQGCTNLSGVPHTFRLLEEAGFRARDLPSLRFMTVAGGRLEPDLVARYHAHLRDRGGRFFVMYGQTEATSRISYVPPERLDSHLDSIGVPIPGGAISLVDSEGRAIETAETPGELIYRGPNVMLGYAETRADLARGSDLSELRTGDLAVRDAAGLYRIVGRLKRMSKISGLRISHDALEQALAESGVEEAAVVGDDRRILAVYASDAPEAAVRDRLAAASGLPRLVIAAERVPALPRLVSGKVDYEALKRRLEAEPQRQAADSGDGKPVQALFEEVFAPMRVSGGDSFVSLGGDSLRFVQLSIALEQTLGQAPEGWERMTLDELARLAPGGERPRPAPAERPTIATDFVVRAAAILFVVTHHATHWPIPGGAAALMVLVGFNLARFQGEALAQGEIGRLWRALPLVLAPYYAVLIGYALAWGEIPWASVLLIGNFGFADPVRHDMLPYLYWFVEVFVQTILIVAAIFAVPAIRRFALRRPFAFALAFLGFALALRFGLAEFWSFGGRQIFTIPWNLYLAAFGWAAAVASRRDEKLLLFAIGAVVFPAASYLGGDWTGSWVKYMMQLAVLGALLALPVIRLPRIAILPILTLSAAGYHVYLFHRILPEAAPELLGKGVDQTLFITLSILVGLASGFLAHAVQKALLRGLRHGRQAAERGALFKVMSARRPLFRRVSTGGKAR